MLRGAIVMRNKELSQQSLVVSYKSDLYRRIQCRDADGLGRLRYTDRLWICMREKQNIVPLQRHKIRFLDRFLGRNVNLRMTAAQPTSPRTNF